MLDSILKDSQVLICAGSGGVGKTTISAALGVRAAQLGRRTLVLTVDPAQRLATALGLDLSVDNARPVPEVKDGLLHAAVLNSKKTFDSFIAKHAVAPEMAERILRNRLYQQLSTSLSGSQEFTALERLLEAVESQDYDLVILDTPPTKHAIDFLTAPTRISRLFQDNITRWFMFPEQGSSSLFSHILGRGTKVVLKSLETLTGGPFIEELMDFFSSLKSVQSVLRSRSIAVQDLLKNKNTQFILVTGLDAAKLDEAKFILRELDRMSYHLRMVIMNRAFPEWLTTDSERPNLSANAHGYDAYSKVLNFYKQFQVYYAARYNLYEGFAKSLGENVDLLRIPEYENDVHGFKDLEQLAERLAEFARAAIRTQSR